MIYHVRALERFSNTFDTLEYFESPIMFQNNWLNAVSTARKSSFFFYIIILRVYPNKQIQWTFVNITISLLDLYCNIFVIGKHTLFAVYDCKFSRILCFGFFFLSQANIIFCRARRKLLQSQIVFATLSEVKQVDDSKVSALLY